MLSFSKYLISEGGPLCEHFHLPAQAGSDLILERMKRGYSHQGYLDLCNGIRSRIPNASITTDLMVGFPGEREADFYETVRLAREVQWDSAFSFLYNVRPGTAAAEWEDDVPPEIKRERLMALNAVVEAIARKRNRTLVGEVMEVLVDGRSKRDPGRWRGLTRTNKVMVFPGPPGLYGKFVQVRVKRATEYTLIGELQA